MIKLNIDSKLTKLINSIDILMTGGVIFGVLFSNGIRKSMIVSHVMAYIWIFICNICALNALHNGKNSLVAACGIGIAAFSINVVFNVMAYSMQYDASDTPLTCHENVELICKVNSIKGSIFRLFNRFRKEKL